MVKTIPNSNIAHQKALRSEKSKMTFYTSSKIQDLAKSMIENGLMNIFWSSKNLETLKHYLKVRQDSRYLQASSFLPKKTQNLKSVKDGSSFFKNQDDKYKNDL